MTIRISYWSAPSDDGFAISAAGERAGQRVRTRYTVSATQCASELFPHRLTAIADELRQRIEDAFAALDGARS
ncbi:MAG: hypothetical protein BroJett013_30260 [Alphaproteobacteria bacterium]|nr:MAG: hypothetical protein BroJett013_30260 [Alphaproteobacteria bacterium]